MSEIHPTPVQTIEPPPPAVEAKIPLDVPVVGEAGARRAARRERVAAELRRTAEEHERSARGDGRTKQSSLLVMAPIRADQLEPLKRLLGQIADPGDDDDLELNPVIPFLKLRTVHFCRLLIHYPSPSEQAPIPVWDGEPQADGPPIPAKLLFATDFDGPLDAHLDELLRVAGPGLDRVFAHCEGWPGVERAEGYFLRHRVASNTFYTGTMKRSVDQIRREARLHDRIEAFLDAEAKKAAIPQDPCILRERIRAFVAGDPELAWTKVEPGPFPTPVRLPFNSLGKTAVAALVVVVAVLAFVLSRFLPLGWSIALAVAPFVLLGAAAYAAFRYLSRLAATDPVIIRDTVKDHTAQLVKTEDRIVQNEMSSVIYIKRPLWFRRMVLWLVLFFVDKSARYLSNQGKLAGIPSIHFARWVIVDGGRRLVFFSNFDGSWENYLGDFIDKSATGLTAVWSNCIGFPRTRGLTQLGARDEQKFKAYSRDSQIPTQVWYSAYKWLSVSNINDNSRIRLGLRGEMTREQAQEWLRFFSGGGIKVMEPKPEPQKPAPVQPVEVADVQGLVARSYAPLKHAVYVPVAFTGAAPAAVRAWLGALLDEVTPAERRTKEVAEQGHALQVAFTRPGLEALGLAEDAVESFSREFQEGMTAEHRRRLLGDRGDAGPDRWAWGGPKNPAVHAVLFLYAASPERLAERLAAEGARAGAHGVALQAPLPSIMLAGDKEHFGFHDGIAQPRIAGMPKPDEGDAQAQSAIPAGEVVLGYPNAYGQLPDTPSVADTPLARRFLKPVPADPDAEPGTQTRYDLGRNGTYLVFRTLEQDVQAFWRWVDGRAQGDAAARKKLAAKMVGRWPNGAPLVQHPDEEPAEFDAKRANDFMYARKYADIHGDRCPLGSHIRRTNPRDGMQPDPRGSLLVADRHRLLRRGRAYGEPLAPSFDPADVLAAGEDAARRERGLQFICFSADLGRQFEFVQNTWVNSGKFDGLYADPDPVIAPHVDPQAPKHPEEVSSFTTQRCPVRHREAGVPRFVTMRGGAYLFMPGLNALRYLASPE